MKKALFFPLQVSLCTVGYLYASISITQAQVTADGTTNTTVNSDGSGDFTIEQGDRVGNNLFHSFGDFSVYFKMLKIAPHVTFASSSPSMIFSY